MTRFAPALSLVFVCNALPALAQQMVLELDPGQTRVEFTLGDVLHTVHGTFKMKRGEMRIDPATGKATGELIIDATSGDSGSGARDSRMHKNILESGKYPAIALTPDRFDGKLNLQGDSEVQLHGQFGIHGSQHEITLPVKVHIREQQLEADTQFPVPYQKWGMKNPSTFILRVDDTVQIQIHAVGRLSPPP
ncbi:MAG: YceI family protein [Bryobacteraceae bacterium]|jgi:polyisoprenoid-binding protein YceI